MGKRFISLAIILFWTISLKAQNKMMVKPNIIIIMADDLGYSDIGCFGGEISTPNLDRLSKGGLRMTNFYNNARCSPTRASLLTGQYAHKVGLASNGNSLTKNGITIAELLKENGYQTGMVGKWHLSDDIQQSTKDEQLTWLNHQAYKDVDFASKESYPINRGFQKFYGIIWGVVNYFDPFSLVEGDKIIKEVPKDYYITDAINKKSIEFITNFTDQHRPYFLYVAHTAPHWPIQAREEDILKYLDTYKMGWDELHKKRYEKMIRLGLINTSTTSFIDVMGNRGKWDNLSPQEKEKQVRKMAVHAAMVSRLDLGVGQIIKKLEETKTLDNTLILFLADNGASPEIPLNPGYDRPSQTREGTDLQYDNKVTIGNIGSQISYTGIGQNWANAANTPYRYWKMESFEGGLHTPMIIHWPNGLKRKKGTTSNALGHVSDIFPTIMHINNLKYPKTYQENKLTSLDGESFLPIIKNKSKIGRDGIFFEHAKGKAYIKNGWKLVMKTNGSEWELYQLSKDKNEITNLAALKPETVKIMRMAWEKWYAEMRTFYN